MPFRKSKTPLLKAPARASSVVLRNRTRLERNRSWVLLEGRNEGTVIESGIAKRLAIASGDVFPNNPKDGQIFIKDKKVYYYKEEN